MAVDGVTTAQRTWYSSYKSKIISGHTRTGHWTPENNVFNENVNANDANGEAFPFPVEDNLVKSGDGKPTPAVNGELSPYDTAPVDRNNNAGAKLGAKLDSLEDVKTLPQPIISASEPTQSCAATADRRPVSVSAEVETDRRRSWMAGKKAIWASFSSDDDDLQKYRITKSDSASTEELDVPITPSRSTAPSLLARSLSSVPSSENRCKTCDGRLYEMEKIVADHVAYHRNCFRCNRCQRTLSLANFISVDGNPYCKSHFMDFVTGIPPKNVQEVTETAVSAGNTRQQSEKTESRCALQNGPVPQHDDLQNGPRGHGDLQNRPVPQHGDLAHTSISTSSPAVGVRPETSMQAPRLAEVKLLKTRFESPKTDSRPVKDSVAENKTKSASKLSVVSEPFSSCPPAVTPADTPAVPEHDAFHNDESSKISKRVRFSDDMTGIYVVNPDPEDTVENSFGLNASRLNNFIEDDDDDEKDDEVDVFPDTLITTVKLTEPEPEVIAVADAFAKFRRLDQQIGDDDDVPKERKPVRKITPPREEPTLFERYQQTAASSATKTDSSIVSLPTEERVPDVDIKRDTVDTGHLKSAVGPVEQTLHQFQTHGDEDDRPEPGKTWTLRTRWELLDAGLMPSNSTSDTNGNNVLASSAEYSGGNQDLEVHQLQTEERLARVAAVDVKLSRDPPTSVAGCSSTSRPGLPSSMAFTKNRLAKFRLLESMHLEKTPEVVRHKTFKWTVKEPVIIHRQSVAALVTANPPIIAPPTDNRLNDYRSSMTTGNPEDTSDSVTWSSRDSRDRDADEQLPPAENMFVLLEKFRAMEDASLPPPVPVSSQTNKAAKSVSGSRQERVSAHHNKPSPIESERPYYNDDLENGFGNIDSEMVNGFHDDTVKLNYF